MARSRSRAAAAGGPRRGAKAPAARETRARSRKAAPVATAEVEVVEEERGMGIDEGLIVMSTLLLLAAVLVTDYVLGTYMNEGWFFKG